MTTPEKYIPDQRDWERKEWQYEQYWADLKSTREMAKDIDASRAQLRRSMDENGIPKRLDSYNPQNAVSPFAGFYSGSENSPTDEQSRSTYRADYDKDPTLMG